MPRTAVVREPGAPPLPLAREAAQVLFVDLDAQTEGRGSIVLLALLED
jgi:hypothetical protein